MTVVRTDVPATTWGTQRTARARQVVRSHDLNALAVQADLMLVQDAIAAAGERRTAAARAARDICAGELDVAQAAIDQAVSGEREPRARRDARIEFAWHAVHRARAMLPLIVPDDALGSQYLYAVERVGRMRPRNGELLSRLTRLARTAPATEAHRHTLSYALSAAYGAADREYRQMRHLRDRLMRVAWATTVALLVVVAAGTLVPTLFPLCLEGAAAACPAGGATPTAGDVASVAALGMVGAGITAVVAVRRTRPSLSPYRITPALGWLRIPFGGIVAVVGVMVLQAQIVTGFVGLATRQEIAVYALVFGFAQEAVTRLLENRAAVLQDAVGTSSGVAVAPAPGDGQQPDRT
ncbi:hypothetical protein [Cellulomonas dongxiuzhuiae]|uniref:hypothetical protein n=1 Tax=Cellulomonas dongxiuzhuiae TaxID=2819979 RepID=UPI001AB00976|nr:hypothetical protein [Cellulomonas dongxiuzhuiae]MBO3087054.1 hypothetical protein [Cellulomonas dongxiuzhuiae]